MCEPPESVPPSTSPSPMGPTCVNRPVCDTLPVAKGTPWFGQTAYCLRANAYLRQLEQALEEGDTNLVETLIDSREFKRAALDIEHAHCPLLCGLVIETLKRVMFAEGMSERENYKRCQELIRDAWARGRTIIRSLAKNHPNKAALNPDDLLGGWAVDLADIKQVSLPAYVGILGCEELYASASFSQAIDKLLTRALDSSMDVSALRGAASALMYEVLGPMQRSALGCRQLVGYLEKATRIATEAALRCSDDPLRLEPLEELAKTVTYLGLGTKRGKRGLKGLGMNVINAMHNELFRLYRQAAAGTTCDVRLGDVLGQLVPVLRSYRYRRKRHVTSGKLEASLRILGQDEEKDLRCHVEDITYDGRGLLVRFGDNVKACKQVGEAKLIPRTRFSNICIDLDLTTGESVSFHTVRATLAPFTAGAESIPVDHALAVRAFRYEFPQQYDGQYGAALFVPTPPQTLVKLAQRFPERVGPGGGPPAGGGALLEATEPSGGSVAEPEPPPFPAGEAGMLQGLRNWVSDLADSVDEGGCEAYWSGGKPVTELNIASQIRPGLIDYVTRRGGTVVCEYWTPKGPADFWISHYTHSVALELKRSRNANWAHGISTQLPTYMGQKQGKGKSRQGTTGHGLYLLFAFQGTFGKGSARVKELRKLQNKVCRELGVRIDVAIVNCDRPDPAESASRRPALPVSAERLQYYPGPEVPEAVQTTERE